MNKFLVVGVAGFIGGHFIQRLLDEGNSVRAVDLKPFDFWFQKFDRIDNHSLDMQEYKNCLKMSENVDYVINLACNMGGIGFIEKNKADCMLSVLINTNLLKACQKNNVKRYFFSSSACAYNKDLQNDPNIDGLKEQDAYPAMPEDGYGWEKLFSERMCRHFTEDFKLQTRVARYHNVYGPLGTYDGGREKAPAALCRKIIEAKLNSQNKIQVWGDGEQTRSFMFIDDCLKGTKTLFSKEYIEPFNIGSEEQVSINQMIEVIQEIANIKVEKEYQLDKPLGVRGRSSNNDLVREKLNWDIEIKLKDGLEKTYKWIYDEITSGKNNDKFSKSSY